MKSKTPKPCMVHAENGDYLPVAKAAICSCHKDDSECGLLIYGHHRFCSHATVESGLNGGESTFESTKPSACPLRNDWRAWSESKRADRLFMSCPSCGKYGSHVSL